MLLTLVVACSLGHWRRQADRLHGEYYQGDGLGYNLHLTLKHNGTFDCQWTGCLGEYGATSGTWTHLGKRITLDVTESSGMFNDRPLGDLTIVTRDGARRLLLDADAKLVASEPDMWRFLSFCRVETQ